MEMRNLISLNSKIILESERESIFMRKVSILTKVHENYNFYLIPSRFWTFRLSECAMANNPDLSFWKFQREKWFQFFFLRRVSWKRIEKPIQKRDAFTWKGWISCHSECCNMCSCHPKLLIFDNLKSLLLRKIIKLLSKLTYSMASSECLKHETYLLWH